MMKSAVVLALVLGFNAILGAQDRKVDGDIVHMSGGVSLSTAENVRITADRVELNQRTGEMLLFGTVTMRQELRPAAQTVTATNLAGAPFPESKQVTFQVRSGVQVSVGALSVHADEIDFNGLTGEMTLRGNVRVTNSKWVGQLQWAK